MACTVADEHDDWMWDRLSIILHGAPLALPPPRAEPSYVDVRHYLNQIRTAAVLGEATRYKHLLDSFRQVLVRCPDDHIPEALDELRDTDFGLGADVQDALTLRFGQQVQTYRRAERVKGIVERISRANKIPRDQQGVEFKRICAAIAEVDPQCTEGERDKIDEAFGLVKPLGLGKRFLDDMRNTWNHVRAAEAAAHREEARRLLLEGQHDGRLVDLIAEIRHLAKEDRLVESKGRFANDDDDDDSEQDEDDEDGGELQRDTINSVPAANTLVDEMATSSVTIPTATLARAVVGWIRHHGGRFFKLTAGPRFLLFGSEMLEITASDKSDFYGWLYEHSGLSTKDKDGKAIVEGCLAEAQRHGTELPWATWVRTSEDDDNPELRLHLHGKDESVLVVRPGRIETKLNGDDDRLILIRCDKAQEFRFIADREKLASAPEKLKRLFLDRLACSPSERLFVLCYTLAVLLRDWAEIHPALQIGGDSDAGKTFIAKMMTTLIYGRKVLLVPTTAASYALASTLPLLVLDNKETKTLSEADKMFVLVAVTRAEKAKRTQGTETGVTFEDPNACVVLTAIEGQSLTEVRNRTFSVQADKRYWQKKGVQTIRRLRDKKAIRELGGARDELLSWLLHMLAEEIFPAVQAGRIDDNYDEIANYLRVGQGDRGIEFLALMKLWLDALAPTQGVDAREVLQDWLLQQAESSMADQVEGSELSLGLRAVLNDIGFDGVNGPQSKARLRGLAPQEDAGSVVGFEGTMKDLVLAVRDLVPGFPYTDASTLQKRLKTSEQTLAAEGWTFSVVGSRTRHGMRWEFKYAPRQKVPKGRETDADLERFNDAGRPSPVARVEEALAKAAQPLDRTALRAACTGLAATIVDQAARALVGTGTVIETDLGYQLAARGAPAVQ